MATARESVLAHARRVSLRDEPAGVMLVSYNDWSNDSDGEWFRPEHLSGSYYSGGFVCLANYNVFTEELFSECFNEGWALYTPGGHQTYGLLLHVEKTPDEAFDTLAALADYPLIDEEAHSRLECEAQSEAWEAYGRREWVRECEKRFGFDADDDIPEGFDWEQHCHDACEAANVYWEAQGDEQSMWLDMARAVKKAEDPRETAKEQAS